MELDAEVRALREAQAASARSTWHARAGFAIVLALAFAAPPYRVGAQKGIGAPLTVRAPFTVVDDLGQPVAIVQGSNKGDDVRRGLAVYSLTGNATSGVFANSDGDGLLWVGVNDPGLKGGSVRIGISEDKQPGLAIYHGSTKVIRIADDQGAGLISVNDAAGNPMVRLQEKSGAIGRGAVVFAPTGKAGASVTADPKGGIVKVYMPNGTSVGGLLAGQNGGQVDLTSAVGGKSGLSLSVQPAGGMVRLFPAAGGTARAELSAEAAGGAMTLYDGSSSPALVLQTNEDGGGRLEINRAKQIFVEAGINGVNRGVVRVGPFIGGPPVGALGYANMIVGAK